MLKVFSISLPPPKTFGDFFFFFFVASLSLIAKSLSLSFSLSVVCSRSSHRLLRDLQAGLLHRSLQRCLASPSLPRVSGIRCVCGVESCCGDDDQDNGEGIEGQWRDCELRGAGPTATEFFFAGKTEETVKRMADACPMGRIGGNE
ncbi:hypothetical protein Scep_021126 [Stephania cephalantha]|uniref:Uncharacterized protein n=1 Tax=Stephania cephalantha TaxID=152367 RepID=A0AAP0F8F3_9MAGN